MGDAGTGKSTLVEKLTAVRGRISHDKDSSTLSSEAFCVPDGSLIVSDTPGSNSRKNKLQHNVWIAMAFNYRPVSKVFIVVKAETRIDSVIDDVRKYADNFLELPPELVGVLVTHMDVVKRWTEIDFSLAVSEDFGIESVVYSARDTTGGKLVRDILATCNQKHELTVDSENFLKLFKIHNHQQILLKYTNEEVARFRAIKRAFDIQRQKYGEKDQVDLVFEFQAYMTDEITRAQQRMSEKNGFTFFGEKAANEAGHTANLANKLRVALFDIRTECLKYQSDQNASELRKCPYCGHVWAKVEGCDGATTCGNRPSTLNDMRSSEYAVLSTYTFRWFGDRLRIEKTGKKKVSSSMDPNNRGNNAGCGKSITWSKMAKADVPPEYCDAGQVSTADIKVLPPEATMFEEKLDDMFKSAKFRIKLSKPR